MDQVIERKQAGAYSADYLDWKSWGDEGFGALTASTERYYAAEVKRAGLLGTTGLDVLEIGFGNGDFLTFSKRQEWKVIGTEMIPELVVAARDAGFQAYDASHLSKFDAASLDLVMAMDVLEHIPADDIVPFIREIMRILRPGGVLLSHFPNGDSPFGLLYQNGDATHLNAIGTGKARYYARMVGAEVVLLAGEARPIAAGSLAHSAQRLVAWPFKTLLNLLVRFIFLPGSEIDYSAPALTMILRKPADRMSSDR